jgi:hypothetical protein
MDSTRRTVWGLTEFYRWIIKSQLDGYIARYHTFYPKTSRLVAINVDSLAY